MSLSEKALILTKEMASGCGFAPKFTLGSKLIGGRVGFLAALRRAAVFYKHDFLTAE
ncbi:hypothetical protein [Noviherbaspirillum aerium]|uniref:hypothetical protein n=1 Tax=Noviherbaspirillum aerium TaxID=2588497 RepID=UPI00178C3A58|nr:hypothetical protein [Noviherbaspirillum aerium]